MKSKKIALVAVIAIIAIAGYFATNTKEANNNPTEIEVDNGDINTLQTNLPVSYSQASYMFDPADKERMSGLSDYIFVAKIVSYDKTIHKDVFTMESEEGPKQNSSPFTQYTVEVIDNLKGKLKKNQPIQIVKDGGVTLDEKAVVIFEDDSLPIEGKYYIITGEAQDDGTILVSGAFTNILLNANSKQEIVSSTEYKEYKKAVKNEVKFERERFKSKFEE